MSQPEPSSSATGPPAGGSPALALFAKVPAPGRVKTRLCPPLSPAEAAGLYRGFLQDLCGAPAPDGVAPYLYGWPGDELGGLVDLVPPDLPVRPQTGPDLWVRMQRCMAELFAEGHGPVGIRNTDSPDLPLGRIADGFRRAAPGRVVLGPDPGGGYYLVVLAAPCPELLSDPGVPADQVLDATIARARALGLAVDLLPEEPDVDTFDDLLGHWRRRAEGG